MTELPSLPKPKRAWEQINQEYQAAAAQLGQATYVKAKADAEINQLSQRMYQLEVEAQESGAQSQPQQQQAAPVYEEPRKKPRLVNGRGRDSNAVARAKAIARAEEILMRKRMKRDQRAQPNQKQDPGA